MIKIINLSEGQEDFFLIQIASQTTSSINILIDGGKSKRRCIEKLSKCNLSKIDYIILTHIDSDHLQGLLGLFDAQNEKFKNAVIVYNKFVNGMISYSQAEKFEKLIENKDILVSYKEYQDNKGDIIFLSVSQRSKLIRNKDSVYITFLSPSRDIVEKLYCAYEYYKKHKKNISDNAEIVNRSSIMFLLEWRNNSVLMLGDGYISDIIKSIDLLSDSNYTFDPIKKVNLIKLPHHGSEENNAELNHLLSKLPCEKFILTTSDTGNVNIPNILRNQLEEKYIYSATPCKKLEELNTVYDSEIELKD